MTAAAMYQAQKMAKMSKDKIKEMPKNILNILKYTKTHKQRFKSLYVCKYGEYGPGNESKYYKYKAQD